MTDLTDFKRIEYQPLVERYDRLRHALLLIEEVTTDPKLDDKSARRSAWSFASVALNPPQRFVIPAHHPTPQAGEDGTAP